MDEYEEVDLEALERLRAATDLESMVHPELSPTAMAEKILSDAAPAVAAGLVKIALHEPNVNARLRAQQYLLDRTLGKSGDGPTKQSPWDELFAQVTDSVNN